jgi:hypothetical protein
MEMGTDSAPAKPTRTERRFVKSELSEEESVLEEFPTVESCAQRDAATAHTEHSLTKTFKTQTP